MKSIYLLVLLTLIAGSTAAQRAITFSDLPFEGGQQIEEFRETSASYAASIETEVRKTGNNQVWDFSNAPTTGETYRDTIEYIDPSATLYGSLFPNATHAEQDDDSSFTYYLANTERVEVLGSASPGLVSRNSGLVLFRFPLNFGQNLDETFTVISTDLETGEADTASGRIQVEYSGYGTVRLPQGTFADVVQLKNRSIYETPMGAFISENYSFQQLGTRLTLATYDNPSEGEKRFDFIVATPTNRKAPRVPALLSLAPNPTSGQVQLTFVQRESGPAFIEVVDLLGRRVHTHTHVGSIGIQKLELNLEAPAGVYSLVVRTASGSTAQKLILN